MPKVSIIILTYNSSDYIGQLIQSINASHENKNIEIIIVDNNSTDNTLEKVGQFKEIVVKKNDKNLGFAGGINSGAKIAGGEYLTFVNPDTEFSKGNIFDLVSVFEKFDNAGVVGGKLIDKNGKPEKSAGKFFGILETFLISVGLDELFGVRFSPDKIQKVDFVSGGFFMIRKDLFEKLNGFDENFFMYVEDMELCYRLKIEGFFTYFTPAAVLVHASHGSSSRSYAVENIYKGLLYFQKKHGTALSYKDVKIMLRIKAQLLVIVGRMLNNKYLAETYGRVAKR